MNNDTFKRLQEFEIQLRSAVNSNYARMSNIAFEKFADIYAEMYGTPLTKSQKNCSSCRLTALKKVGNEYFTYKPKGRPPKIKNEEKENESLEGTHTPTDNQ